MRLSALSPLILCTSLAAAQPVIEITPATPGGPATGESISRPDTAGRIVKVFDFEEQRTNPGDVPQNWFRSYDEPDAGRPRPGFPAWNKAALSYVSEGGAAFAGAGSVMLPTQGGSTSLILGQGVLPVFQNADYLVSAKVRTEGLVHARAAIVARFLDKSGVPINESDARSALTITARDWQDIRVELVGEFDQAAYIQLELQVLQPQQYEPSAVEPRTADPKAPPLPGRIWAQDITGAAWFDNVAVVQLPRVELSTTSPCNIVAAPEQPQLKMLVRDLTGESLSVRLEVLDDEGRVADRLSRNIGAGFTSNIWKPTLTKLGWYRATMDIVADRPGKAPVSVGRVFTDFVWIPADAVADARWAASTEWTDRRRFGLVVDELPAPLAPRFPALARNIGAGCVTLPVWDESLTLDNAVARADALRPVIDALYSDRRQVSMSLPKVPAALARQSGVAAPSDPWTVLAGDPKTWLPYAAPALERFGQRVNHWQIGAPGDDRTYWRKDLGREFQAITQTFARLVPGPVLTIPTLAGRSTPPALESPRPSDPSGTTLPPALLESVPPDTTAPAVALAAKAWASASRDSTAEMTLLFEPFDAARYGVAAGAPETAKRAVEFWAASWRETPDRLAPGVSIALDQPWRWTSDRRPQLLPTPELAAWRCAIDRLAGRRVVGMLPVADGAVCYILAPAEGSSSSRGGALAAWNESAQPQDAVLEADLGDGPLQLIDIFGNSRPLSPGDATIKPGGASPQHAARPLARVPLGSSPIFIEGVDIPLVRFTSTFAIDPPFLESSNDQHERELVITNPWPTSISGRVTILEPGGFETGQKDRSWRISPRSQRFNVPAGQSQRLPIKIAFSPVEEVGPRDFVMAVELTADKPYGTVEIRRPVQVGVKNINLDLAAATQGRNGEDLAVEATVVNTGQNPLTLELTAFANDFPRSKASITGLTAGHQSLKRFVYPGAAAKLRGQRIIVSVYDPDSKMRVNKSILIR